MSGLVDPHGNLMYNAVWTAEALRRTVGLWKRSGLGVRAPCSLTLREESPNWAGHGGR